MLLHSLTMLVKNRVEIAKNIFGTTYFFKCKNTLCNCLSIYLTAQKHRIENQKSIFHSTNICLNDAILKNTNKPKALRTC